jgi:hypothetical protein
MSDHRESALKPLTEPKIRRGLSWWMCGELLDQGSDGELGDGVEFEGEPRLETRPP